MRVLITGGRGFIASALIPRLLARGEQVTLLSRSPESIEIPGVTVRGWCEEPRALIGDAEALINLAGSPLFAKPTSGNELCASRIDVSQRLMEALKQIPDPPRTWINASAIWVYGQTGDELVDENHSPGTGPLVSLCNNWEDACSEAKQLGIRAIRLRAGLVLDEGGGPLAQLLPILKFYEGDSSGPGRRILSWIHRSDMVSLILFCLDNFAVWGPINAVCPSPSSIAEFGRLLRRAMGSRKWDIVPGQPVSSLYPDAADILFQGCKVAPAKARSLGFEFQYPTLQSCVDGMYDRLPA